MQKHWKLKLTAKPEAERPPFNSLSDTSQRGRRCRDGDIRAHHAAGAGREIPARVSEPPSSRRENVTPEHAGST